MQVDLRVPLQARSVRTRGDVVEAARKEFTERGYALTTTKSVAARAGVATGTFYHYFPDKDALLREICAARVDALERRMSGNAPDIAAQAQVAEARARTRTQVADARAPDALLGELKRRIRKDVRVYLDYHRTDGGLHAVISERRLCDPALDAIMTRAEQRGVRRTTQALQRWGFVGDAQAAAFMIFSLLDGAVHNHVFGQSGISDARFVEALVEAVLRIGGSPSIWKRSDAGK